MAEIKFKPSIKREVIGTGVSLLTLIIGGVILSILFPKLIIPIITGSPIVIVFIIIGLFSSIFYKLFMTYTITDNNEVILEYNFINTSTKVYRIDQITSVTLKQGLIDKFLSVGTIHFGIYGSTGANTTQQQGGGKQEMLSANFLNIKDPQKAYEKFASLLGVDLEKKLYSQKPSTKPIRFQWIIYSILLLGTILAYFSPLSTLKYGSQIILGVAGLLVLILLGKVISYFRYKHTNYDFMEKSLIVSYDYLFSHMKEFVPYKRITDVYSNKNAISYALFKVASVTIFTGGSRDPSLHHLLNYEAVQNLLSSIVKSKDNVLEPKEVNNYIKESGATKEEHNEYGVTPEVVLKPGISYVLKIYFILFILLLFGLGIIYFVKVYQLPLTLALIFVILVLFLINTFHWKNISYELYEDKIVSNEGIISIERKEIYIKNIKYVTLQRSFFFERLFDQGTVVLYTAGTGGANNMLEGIEVPHKYYELIKKNL